MGEKVRQASDLDHDTLVYLAGLFDGNGYIGIHAGVHSRASGPQMNHALVAAICTSNRNILNWLKAELGGTISIKPGDPPSGQWRLSAWDAQRFIEAISPFLRIKKRHAKLGLRYMQTAGQPHRPPARLPDSVVRRREAYRFKLQALNSGSIPLK